MIGKLLYRCRKQFGRGFHVAWQRDVVRWRVLKTPPISGLTDATCEIHVLTCDRDWLDLIWCLKSFFSVCEVRFRLCIHDDGSVRPEGISALRQHFPDARVIRRNEADRTVGQMLKNYPRCHELRRTNNLALKVFDFLAYLEGERLFLLDSDILFFRRPSVLIERLTNRAYRQNSLNRDWGMGYSVDPEAVSAALSFPFQSHINSGLGLIHKASYDLNDFERWLQLPEILSHSHRVEQTLVALASSKFGHEFLPGEYDVRLVKTRPDEIVKHYTGPIRHLMYGEGLNRVRSIASAVP
jgi:hypothetical protein